MTINNTRMALIILIISAITYLIRALPFILFPGNKKTPSYILYLGKVLPYSIIGMLVIYCFKGVHFLSAPFGIPEIIAAIVIILVHIWKRNTLLSIAGGTILYMFLIQKIFI